MKAVFAAIAGVIGGFVLGYWLHSTMSPPFGSARGEERILTRDLNLAREFAFAPDNPDVLGVVSKGSHFTVDFRKSEAAMYVSFETILSHRTILDASIPAADRRTPPSPN